jgi:hypothetical protein
MALRRRGRQGLTYSIAHLKSFWKHISCTSCIIFSASAKCLEGPLNDFGPSNGLWRGFPSCLVMRHELECTLFNAAEECP